MIFVGGLLPSEGSSTFGVTKEAMEVLAPILEMPTVLEEVGASIPILEAVSVEKQKGQLATTGVVNIERETEPALILVSEAAVTKPVTEPSARFRRLWL